MAKPVDPVVKELDAVKRLLVLQLLTSGVQANIVAAALGVLLHIIMMLGEAGDLGQVGYAQHLRGARELLEPPPKRGRSQHDRSRR